MPSAEELYVGIKNRDIGALGRGITLIESTKTEHEIQAQTLISLCLPDANQSVRIGITGVPGVGKSTFIEAFGSYLTSIGKKVAVLAVDPSSSVSQGSILGDKTRMEALVRDPNAFIRPSASGENLGGVARKTRESITLCEAFGFDTILVETVGVGQSETEVNKMVDFFLLLQLAGAGDQLQGIKRGIMEMADAIVINKADGENQTKARMARVDYARALQFFPSKPSQWSPVALTCSAIEKKGIAPIARTIEEYIEMVRKNGYFEKRRQTQNLEWMSSAIREQLHQAFTQHPVVAQALSDYEKKVISGKMSPFAAARELLQKYVGT